MSGSTTNRSNNDNFSVNWTLSSSYSSIEDLDAINYKNNIYNYNKIV